MNVVTRGIKNASRSPIRSGAIILMLAISVGLILSMLVARSSVNTKIKDIKASTGTGITVTAAGIQGFSGGGEPLTSTELALIRETSNIEKIVTSLTDQLSSSDTNLVSSQELGSFGSRQMRFESSSSSNTDTTKPNTTDSSISESNRPAPTPRITVTGTSDQNSISSSSSTLNITSGESIDGSSNELIALVGTSLAEKNNLTIGSTFTAYEKTITVIGIFETGNAFSDSGIVMPISTVQTLSEQPDAITSIKLTVNSVDNVETIVSQLESKLEDKADITSSAEQAKSSIESLQSISNLALVGVIGSTIAGIVILLLSMIMIVKERSREIGVIKAIGGTNFKVIAQFISEALTLSIIGSIVGFAIGIAASGPMTESLVSNSSNSTTASQTANETRGPGSMMRMGMNQINANFTEVTSTLTPTSFVIAIGITLIIAIIGSAVPAWLIARVSPAEVLRSE